jgi:hypothetical protein
MRILRDGPTGDAWKLEIECPGCKSLLEVVETDLRPLKGMELFNLRINRLERNKRTHAMVYICTCPKRSCEENIEIPHAQLPPELQQTPIFEATSLLDFSKPFDFESFFPGRKP